MAAIWKERSEQVAELQVLCVDVENGTKAGECFYKIDEASIITIREEFVM